MTKLIELSKNITDNVRLLETLSNRNGFNVANIGSDEVENGGITFFQQQLKDEILKDILRYQIASIKGEAEQYGVDDISEDIQSQFENIDELNLAELKELLKDVKSLELRKNDILAKKIAETQAERMKAEQLARLEIEARQKREAADLAAKDAEDAENLRATEQARLGTKSVKTVVGSNKAKINSKANAESNIGLLTDNDIKTDTDDNIENSTVNNNK